MQSIIYNGDYVVLYRGGYDRENRKGLDRFVRRRNPLTEWSPTGPSDIANGMLGQPDTGRANQFFGYTGNPRDLVIDGSWKVCFDADSRMVLYPKSVKDPKRVVGKSKTKSGRFLEWTRSGKYATDGPPWVWHGWEFKDPRDYLILDVTLWEIYRLLPDQYEAIVMKDLEPGIDPRFSGKTYQEITWAFWELDPVDLDDPWDYSDAQKIEIAKANDRRRAEKLAEKRELERLRKLPGHCCVCGADGAKLSMNPLSIGWGDLGGETEWLCERCWEEKYGYDPGF